MATRQHVECSPRIRIRRRIERGTSITAVATCVERSWIRKGHAPAQTHPARPSGNAQSRRVCERPHLRKRQLIADVAHPTFTTESESFSSRLASLLNPMSVSSGPKRPHQKWMARDTCLFIIAKLSVHTLVRFGLVFQRSVTLSRCHPHRAHFSHEI